MNTSRAEYAALWRDVSRAGVYHLPHAPRGDNEAIIGAAEDCGYAVFRVDLARAADRQGLLAALARDMAFPEWFGNNWDALADCVNDLGWRPAEGYLVLLEHCDLLHEHAASELVAALQIFGEAADNWRQQGVPLWCLVDMQADGIAWLPGL